MTAPMPRQSIYPGASTASAASAPSTSHLSSLQTCLDSLDHSINVLSHTNDILAESVADVPRLATVLTSRRHFDVVTESQVVDARKQLEVEVRPHLKELLRRGEEEVEREAANARRAKNKVSQLTTRLEQVLTTQKARTVAAPQTVTAHSTAAASLQERRAIEEEQTQRADLQRVQRRRAQLEEELRLLEEQLDREMAQGAA